MTDRIVTITLLATVLAATAAFAAPAAAGDAASVYFFEPDEIDAEPGDVVEIDAILSSHGSYDGAGLVELAFTIDYDDEILSVADVETEPWLAGDDAESGDEDDVETVVETDPGSVTVEQSRGPPGDGATGTAPVATLTVEVAEGADAGETTLEFADSAAATAEYPQNTIDRTATIEVVDEGGDTDDVESDAGTADEGSDAVPGFALPGSIAALAVASVLSAIAERVRG